MSRCTPVTRHIFAEAIDRLSVYHLLPLAHERTELYAEINLEVEFGEVKARRLWRRLHRGSDIPRMRQNAKAAATNLTYDNLGLENIGVGFNDLYPDYYWLTFSDELDDYLEELRRRFGAVNVPEVDHD